MNVRKAHCNPPASTGERGITIVCADRFTSDEERRRGRRDQQCCPNRRCSNRIATTTPVLRLSVEIDLNRPVKSFDAILNAVVMELLRAKNAKVKLALEIEAEAPTGSASLCFGNARRFGSRCDPPANGIALGCARSLPASVICGRCRG
jgi:hypothetical protein